MHSDGILWTDAHGFGKSAREFWEFHIYFLGNLKLSIMLCSMRPSTGDPLKL